jgi:hypothetical protein
MVGHSGRRIFTRCNGSTATGWHHTTLGHVLRRGLPCLHR